MPDSNDQSTEQKIQRIICELKKLDQTLASIRLPVVGNSMTPMLRDRDILVVSFTPPSKIMYGDIIVWGRHELITHRVVIAGHHRVYTKGDARYWVDPVIDHKEILGTVIQVERNGVIADMESARWKVINKLLGSIGWIQVCLTWRRQAVITKRNGGSLTDRLSFWVSKKLNWIILFLFAGKWMVQKRLRMDEKC